MTAVTGWFAGRGVGDTLTQCVAFTDLASLANGSSVLSSVADIANAGTTRDQFADVVAELSIASATLAAGATFSISLFDKFSIDGTNTYYGDNSLGAGGVQKAYNIAGVILPTVGPTIIGVAQTIVQMWWRGLWLPNGTFRFAVTNNLGFTLGSGTTGATIGGGTGSNWIYYRTYNQRLDNAS